MLVSSDALVMGYVHSEGNDMHDGTEVTADLASLACIVHPTVDEDTHGGMGASTVQFSALTEEVEMIPIGNEQSVLVVALPGQGQPE